MKKTELTKLQQAIIEQLGHEELNEDVANELKNALCYGANVGISGFIYYNETIKFFDDNKTLILEQLEYDSKDCGEDMLTMISNFNCLRDDKFTQTDIMNAIYNEDDENEITIKNALSWYALETVAYQLEEEINELLND